MIFSVIKALINLLYPLKCQLCGKTLHHMATDCICANCRQEITINLPPFCTKCGRQFQKGSKSCRHKHQNMSSIDRAWVACNYQGHIRSVIHNIKYKSKMGLIDFAARICGNFAKRFIDLDSVDYITYVPIDRIRKSQRSFNQSELLARTLAKDLEIQLLDKTIIKTKLTKPQVEADGCQRTINLKGAFSFNKKKLNLVKDKNFLIIDDVLTTGSTLNECACCLKQAGANKVFALALAGGN